MKYYKVVTCDMMSLGLRKNPNIFKYNLHIWKNLYSMVYLVNHKGRYIEETVGVLDNG